MHPDQEVLAELSMGLLPDAPADLIAHVTGCPLCSTSVEALTHTASLLTTLDPEPGWTEPPDAVWAAIEAETAASTGSRPFHLAQSAHAAHPTHPAHVGPAPLPGQPRQHRLVPWVAAAAAAGLALGLLTGRALRLDPAPAPTETTMATAALDTLDTGKPLGDAAVLRTSSTMDLRVDAHDLNAGSGYLEVWLINTDGKRMIAVGVLPGNGTQVFPISPALIDEGYLVVDISREAFDDNPAHSGDSLVRGTLKT